VQREKLTSYLDSLRSSAQVEILVPVTEEVTPTSNIIEHDHRFIKKITKPMMGFKAFHSAQATIAGIETAHILRKLHQHLIL
jgi:transposase-like protein